MASRLRMRTAADLDELFNIVDCPSSTPRRPQSRMDPTMEIENSHLLEDNENPIVGPSVNPNPVQTTVPSPERTRRISISSINITDLLEEMAIEHPSQPRDDGAQHHSSSISLLQAKISEHMRTSLIEMNRASDQRAVMRRALVSGDFPAGLSAKIAPGMMKSNAEGLRKWEVAHTTFSTRLAKSWSAITTF